MLDGNGVITMAGSISVPNSGLFENKENSGSQMGHSNKKYKKIKILIMTLNIYESLSFTERPFSSGFS
jgi:hypothetical protein